MITWKSSRLVSEYPPLSPHYGSLKPKVGPGSKDVSKVLCLFSFSQLACFHWVSLWKGVSCPCFSLFMETALA